MGWVVDDVVVVVYLGSTVTGNSLPPLWDLEKISLDYKGSPEQVNHIGAKAAIIPRTTGLASSQENLDTSPGRNPTDLLPRGPRMTAIANQPAAAHLDRDRAMPGANQALLLLLAINLFNFLDRQVLAAVERQIRLEVLIDETGQPLVGSGMLSGALMFAFLITYMITAPVFGWLADRLPRWRLVAVGVILWSLASGASGLDWGTLLGVGLWIAYCLLFFTRCLVGVGEGAYGPVAPTMLADLYPVSRRGRIMAWFYMAMPVGGAMGYALGDWAKGVEGLGWRGAFFLVTPPGLLLGVLCLFMREPPRGQADFAVKTTDSPKHPDTVACSVSPLPRVQGRGVGGEGENDRSMAPTPPPPPPP
jgi:hypothetical protein